MKFVEMSKEDVKKKARMTKLRAYLEEFERSIMKFAAVELDEGEYSSVDSAYRCISFGIRKYGHPFKASVIGGRLYIEKGEFPE